jgi:hypothetical protein
MKTILKTIAVAAMFAFTAPAFAGGVTVAADGTSKTKVEALFFLNTTMDTTKVNGTKTAESNGLAVDRAYLTVKHYFNDDWMMRFTSDMESASGAGGKQQNIYLKYAYVEGKLAGKAAVLRLGQSHTPWIDYEQHLWGHRYVAKVTSDYFKFDDSSDLGVGLKGKVADGMVKYWATATTGAGYGNKTGSTKGIDYNFRVGVYPIEGLTLDVQHRTGYRGTKTFGVAGTKNTLTQVMASYGMGKTFRVGANWLSNKGRDSKGVNKGTNIKANGYSVWGTAKFAGSFGAFARYDSMKDKGATGVQTAKNTRTVAGIEYSPIKNVTFSLAGEEYKNAVVGGNTTKNSRIGLFSQIKL